LATKPVDDSSGLSRRELLKRAGLIGAAAAIVPAEALVPAQRPPLETLTVAEADALDAIVARLIPSDQNGPGAREAGAVTYIDRALGGALAPSREAYRSGLNAVDAYARASRGARLADLPVTDQDAVLTDMERNTATGFTPSASSFFNLVRNHTLQGTFGDPYYGGNKDFIGWDLIGYPGLRLAVGPADQQLGVTLTPTHRSAYDHAMFTTKPSRAGLTRRSQHGD